MVNGKKVTSDRPIPRMREREQRELNSDGSLKRHGHADADRRRARGADEKEREAQDRACLRSNDAVRRDRNLMQRFPDEATHRKAREKALDDAQISVKNSGARIALLEQERKKLDEERALLRQRARQEAAAERPQDRARRQRRGARGAALAGAERSRPSSSGSTRTSTPSCCA